MSTHETRQDHDPKSRTHPDFAKLTPEEQAQWSREQKVEEGPALNEKLGEEAARKLDQERSNLRTDES